MVVLRRAVGLGRADTGGPTNLWRRRALPHRKFSDGESFKWASNHNCATGRTGHPGLPIGERRGVDLVAYPARHPQNPWSVARARQGSVLPVKRLGKIALEIAGEMQVATGRFRAGQSGNPSGKPKGARHRTTILAERLMQNDARDVVQAVIAAAKNGDMVAARIVLDRVLPARRGRTLRLSLPPVTTPAHLSSAVAVLVAEVAAGTVTAEEAASVGALLGLQGRALELTEVEARLRTLEQKAGNT